MLKKIEICVPTYCRPNELQTLLASIELLICPENTQVAVCVVDNDRNESARGIVESYSRDSKYETYYLCEPIKGLGSVRNRFFGASEAYYMALIDDDEVATPNWLVELLAVCEKFQSDAVIGMVIPEFPPGAPAWLTDFNGQRKAAPGTELTFGSTANALLKRQFFIKNSIRFDSRFNACGGEDTDFFYRATTAGCRLHFACDAIVLEPFARDRLKLRWHIRRHFRIGQTNWLIFGTRNSRLRTTTHLPIRAVLSLAFIIFGCVTLPLNSPRAVQYLFRGFRNIGYLMGAAGYMTSEYK